MRSVSVLFASLLLLPVLAQAASMVQVVGLFPGAAVVNVDGQRKLVRVGQTGPGGVQVVSADASGAVLRVDGVERHYNLSREYSGAYAAPSKTQLSVAKGTGGHYWIAGAINGQSIQFLVDTGATSVAINEHQARRLGIGGRRGRFAYRGAARHELSRARQLARGAGRAGAGVENLLSGFLTAR